MEIPWSLHPATNMHLEGSSHLRKFTSTVQTINPSKYTWTARTLVPVHWVFLHSHQVHQPQSHLVSTEFDYTKLPTMSLMWRWEHILCKYIPIPSMYYIWLTLMVKIWKVCHTWMLWDMNPSLAWCNHAFLVKIWKWRTTQTLKMNPSTYS